MVDLVVAVAILFTLAVGLTVVGWAWLSSTLTRQIDDTLRSLKADIDGRQTSTLEQIITQLQQLPEPVSPDFEPLVERIQRLDARLAQHSQWAADCQAVLERRLDELAEAVDNVPYPLGPKPINLSPIYDRFQSIDAQLASLGKMIDGRTSAPTKPHVR